jgi:hypothetical protein
MAIEVCTCDSKGERSRGEGTARGGREAYSSGSRRRAATNTSPAVAAAATPSPTVKVNNHLCEGRVSFSENTLGIAFL